MLGKDRHELSKITYQDEYDTSCKYPQRENRPNVIIGDFTMAHHTYGVQEPIMEELKTHVSYEKLCEKLNSGDVEFENKPIGTQLNATTTIAAGGKMLMRAWVENNSYILKDLETGRYIQLTNEWDTNAPNPYYRSKLIRGDNDAAKACIFNIDINKNECAYLNNSTSLLRVASGQHEVEAAFQTPGFFQAQYLSNQIIVKTAPGGKYTIHPTSRPEYRLISPSAHPNLHKDDPESATRIELMIQWSKKDDESKDFAWELEPLGRNADNVVAGVITRAADFNHVANDETTAWDAARKLPDNNCPREWIWMVKDYIWEMVPVHNKENVYKIKLVADDKPDMYLFYIEDQEKMITGGGGDEFEFIDKSPKYLKNVKTGKYLNITDAGQVVLQPNLAELAMCPQR